MIMKVRKNELYEVISNGKFTRKKIPKRDGIHYELERGGGQGGGGGGSEK